MSLPPARATPPRVIAKPSAKEGNIRVELAPLTIPPEPTLFDCGDEAVTRFLRHKPLQHQVKNLSTSMLLINENEADAPNRIIGYHTLLLIQVQ
jgi:hypothetical protein